MLRKKMLRDLRDNKGVYLASMIVLLLAIMIFTSFIISVDNLESSKNSFYTQQNFADGFVTVKALPDSKLDYLAGLPGIQQIKGRIIQEVQVHAPTKEENIYLQLVSIDPLNLKSINDFHLLDGHALNPKEMNIWLASNFAQANGLAVNDYLDIIADGQIRSLRIAGIGMSPEFIYALRGTDDIYPSPETFGIGFLPLEMMKLISPHQQTYNDLVFTISPEGNFEKIREDLKISLEPYGLINILPKEEQTSNLLLTEQIKSIKTMAILLPIIFLAIAAMILYIALGRLVEQQRGQIGVLKALGYTNREIYIHYLSFAFFIALAGSVLGGVLGIGLAIPLTDYNLMFFNMPPVYDPISLSYFLAGVFCSILFSLLAAFQGCKKVLNLQPAEAMRPPAPMMGKKIWLEQITSFWTRLNIQGKMATRNLARNKGRSVFIFLGILFSFALSTFTWSMLDMINQMFLDQYENVELYDLKVTTASPVDAPQVTKELVNFPGVTKVESLAEIPIKLKHNWLEKDLILIGLPKESSLYNILDKNNKKLSPPTNGLLLSQRLANLLDASVGTQLNLKNLLPNAYDEEFTITVAGIVPQYIGLNAYLELTTLQQLFREQNLATSFILQIEDEQISSFQKKYRNNQLITSLDIKEQRLNKFQEMVAISKNSIFAFSLLGIIVGIAIIYSSSLITLAERNRELASMLVLGMTPKEVLRVITWEQWSIAILAIILGMPVSKVFLVGLSQALSNDLYTLPSLLAPQALIIALTVTSISIWLGQQMAAKKIKTISLVEALKSIE